MRWNRTVTKDAEVIAKAGSDAVQIAATLVRLVCDSDHEFAAPVRREALKLRDLAHTLVWNIPVPKSGVNHVG